MTLERQPNKETRIPVNLTPAESTLASKAVGGYSLSQLRILEANWPYDSRRSVLGSLSSVRERVETVKGFVDSCSNLMEKLTPKDGASSTDVSLSPTELRITMNALYGLGVHTTYEAEQAIDSGTLGYSDPSDKEKERNLVANSKNEARTLFRKLEPTAREHRVVTLIWDDKAARHDWS